jgi:hypothetical protein
MVARVRCLNLSEYEFDERKARYVDPVAFRQPQKFAHSRLRLTFRPPIRLPVLVALSGGIARQLDSQIPSALHSPAFNMPFHMGP